MEAIGPLLVVLSIPLILRWVPQNGFFGLRISPTLGNRSVWYEANALHGRHLLLLGLLMVTLEFLLRRSMLTLNDAGRTPASLEEPVVVLVEYVH
jgi:SdpI/YfhL protein family